MMTLAPRGGGSDEYCSLLASVDSLQLFFRFVVTHTIFLCFARTPKFMTELCVSTQDVVVVCV